MRGVGMVLALLLSGCPHSEPPPEVKAEPAPPPPPPPPKPDPLPNWRAGWTSADGIVRKPSESWTITLSGPVTAALCADGDQVYAVADGVVSALSADGHEVWHTRIAGVQGVALAGEVVVGGGADGRLHFLDRTSGRDRSVSDAGAPIVTAPVSVDGGWAWVTADGTVATTAGWKQAAGHPPAGRPAADGSTVFVATTDGFLMAVGPKGVEWSVALPAAAVDGPALSEDGVFVGFAATKGQPGGVIALDREHAGATRWVFHSEFQPLAAPAVEEAVYVPDKDGHVYGLDPVTGARLWATEGYGEFTTQPLVARGSVYVGNRDGHLTRIDPQDGSAAWEVTLGGPISAVPVIVGKRLVVGLTNGRVVGLE